METDGTRVVANAPAVPTVNAEICSGCGRCVAACPLRLITLEVSGFRKGAAIRNPERCNGCGRCVESCPLAAVS